MMRKKIKVTSALLAVFLLASATPATATPSKAVVKKLTFTSKTVDGKNFSSKVLVGKKPSVIWFWAPWCAICHNEAANLVEAQETYGDRVNFIGVGALGTSAELKVFVEETGTKIFTNLDDSKGKLWARFGVVIQPTLIFIDGKGKLTTHIGPSDIDFLNSKLKALTAS
jgi:thiol-disulfide isomerase/thioredoxin